MAEKEKADTHILYRVVSAFFCALGCIEVCPETVYAYPADRSGKEKTLINFIVTFI